MTAREAQQKTAWNKLPEKIKTAIMDFVWQGEFGFEIDEDEVSLDDLAMLHTLGYHTFLDKEEHTYQIHW